jgi:hypothetical protein
MIILLTPTLGACVGAGSAKWLLYLEEWPEAARRRPPAVRGSKMIKRG